MRLPEGQGIPRSALTARSVLLHQRSWLLLRDNPHGGHLGGCGKLAQISGSLVDSRDGPWGRAHDLAKDLHWRLVWDHRQNRGVVSFLARSVTLRLDAGSLLLEAGRYQVPQPLSGALLGGDVVLPIAPVARALGWIYWESIPLRVSGVGTR